MCAAAADDSEILYLHSFPILHIKWPSVNISSNLRFTLAAIGLIVHKKTIKCVANSDVSGLDWSELGWSGKT